MVLRNTGIPSRCGWRRYNGHIVEKRCLDSGIELKFQDPKETINQGQYKEEEQCKEVRGQGRCPPTVEEERDVCPGGEDGRHDHSMGVVGILRFHGHVHGAMVMVHLVTKNVGSYLLFHVVRYIFRLDLVSSDCVSANERCDSAWLIEL